MLQKLKIAGKWSISSHCVAEPIGSCWLLLARIEYYWLVLGGHVGSTRVFGYQHIGVGNAKVSNPHREGFHVAVEYRLEILDGGSKENFATFNINKEKYNRK